MERQRKHWLNAQQKNDIWKMWRAGESLSTIARVLGRHPSGAYRVISKTGGISPVPRTRSARSLSLAEREEIS
jgi:IS30 family transposase